MDAPNGLSGVIGWASLQLGQCAYPLAGFPSPAGFQSAELSLCSPAGALGTIRKQNKSGRVNDR